jgi:hypothetical protein
MSFKSPPYHRQSPSRDATSFPVILDDVPTLSAAGISGSTWHSDGQPIFCPGDDTSEQWGFVRLVMDPRTRQLFRIG